MAVTFDVTVFREQFTAYANAVTYPDSTLQMFFDTATCYVSDADCGRLTGTCRLRALNLMTAHLVALSDIINTGGAPAFVTSATVGSVTVAVQPPPSGDQWQWWLSLTPYGQQLHALLSVTAVAGFYVGGSRERSAFRKLGGVF